MVWVHAQREHLVRRQGSDPDRGANSCERLSYESFLYKLSLDVDSFAHQEQYEVDERKTGSLIRTLQTVLVTIATKFMCCQSPTDSLRA
jgi:hypothetical protein